MDILQKIKNITEIICNIKNIFKCNSKTDKQEYINDVTNKEFNDELNNGKSSSLCDTIRKDKQKIINSLKTILIIFILISNGCIFNKNPSKEEIVESYDINSLKSTDKTYKIVDEQDIKVYDCKKKKDIRFNEDWFVVHTDLLKTMNENQDYIINTLKDKNTKKLKTIQYSGYCIIILLIILIICQKKRKQN